QIHLFLSKALTFFERSGLNVTGGLNLDNVTAFEDEEQFRRAMLGFDGEDEAAAAASAGAAAGATAGKGAGGGESGGDAMDVDAGERGGVGAGAGAGGGGKGEGDDIKEEGEFAVDYRLYQAFWRLQKYALKQDAAVKGAGAKDTWTAILADVDKILDAFEANAFSEHDLRLARERWMGDGGNGSGAVANSGGSSSSGISGSKRRRVSDVMELEANGEAAGEEGGYFGLKYLTSSRLLRLQLRDPTLRLQVLTQWLILAASLKSKVGKDKDSPNSAADLNPRMERAKRLVKATPPRGEEYLNMLQTVLHRESAWTQWKDMDKCKDIHAVPVGEAKSAAAAAAAGVVAAAPSYPNKRQRPHSSVALAERAKHAPLGADFPLEKMVSRLHAGVPSPAEHLEDQRMCAEDPDIPSTELPSVGPLYAWRALRLLGKESPANLAGCYDGDLVAAMDRLDKARNAAEAAAADAKTGSANAAAAAAAAAATAAAEAAAATAAAAAAVTETTEAKAQQPPSAVAASAKGKVEDTAMATAMAVDGEGEGEGEGGDEEGEVELTGAPGGSAGTGASGAGGADANGSVAGEGSGDDAKDNDDKKNVMVVAAAAAAGGSPPSSPRAAATAAAGAGAASEKLNSGKNIAGGGAAQGWLLPEKVSTSAVSASAAAAQPSPTAGEGGGRRKASKSAAQPPPAAMSVSVPTAAATTTTPKGGGSPRSPRLTRRRSKKEENGSGGKN
ncbi:unnamed protein product, partial [Laminaria digitata]